MADAAGQSIQQPGSSGQTTQTTIPLATQSQLTNAENIRALNRQLNGGPSTVDPSKDWTSGSSSSGLKLKPDAMVSQNY
jgi:hypothetical protein